MLIAFRGFVVSPLSSVIMAYSKLVGCRLAIEALDYCLVGRLMEKKTTELLFFEYKRMQLLLPHWFSG